MISSLVDLVLQAASRLSRDQQVDAGLDAVVAAVKSWDTSGDAVNQVAHLLRDRARALKEAGRAIEELGAAIGDLADAHRFTEERWPALKSELEAACEQSPLIGVREWLDEWFAAAAGRRLDAMGRLHEVEHLPDGASLLLQRCATTTQALELWTSRPALAMLAAADHGIVAAGETIPARREILHGLRLLRIRLLLEDELLDEAETLLNDEPRIASVTVKALRARLLRLRRDERAARAALSDATLAGPTDLDVAYEAVTYARLDGQIEAGLTAARTAVRALPARADPFVSIARLGRVPPSELWVALAERLLDEAAPDEAIDDALLKAGIFVESSDYAMRATIAEARARQAERNRESGNGTPSEVVKYLVDAGTNRLLGDQLDPAVDLFSKARKLQRRNSDVALRLADALVTRARTRSLSAAHHDLDRSLSMIVDVQGRTQIRADHAWSYLTEAAARQQLARELTSERPRHIWLAFQAVCRSLAHDPADIRSWTDLSAAAQIALVTKFGVWASKHALELSGGDRQIEIQHAQALANDGRSEEALALLTDSDSWTMAVRGYLLMRLGRFSEAMPLLSPSTADPFWTWASECQLLGILQIGAADEATQAAESIRERWKLRLDEYEGVSITAFAALVVGDLAAVHLNADRILAVMNDPYALRMKAMAFYLQGDIGRCRAMLEQSIRTMTMIGDVRDWTELYGPAVRQLARSRRLKLPSIAWADRLVDNRVRELERADDPIQELRAAQVPGFDLEEAAQARIMGEVLWRIPEGEFAAADDLIRTARKRWPDHPAWRELSRGVDRAQREARRRASASLLVESVRQGQGAAARSAFHDLIVGLDQYEVVTYLRSVIGDDPSTQSAVAKALRPEASSSSRRVRSIVSWLQMDFAPVSIDTTFEGQSDVRLLLPPSWFEGYDDPERNHVLFTRYLPELRLREIALDVPGVRVRTDEALEPDGYRIEIGDREILAGSADPAYRYGPRSAFELLGLGHSRHDDELDLDYVDAVELAGQNALAEVLTMTALELVTRQVSAAIRLHRGSAKVAVPATANGDD
jgi:tetratricopeptide (TPR) repeat protein